MLKADSGSTQRRWQLCFIQFPVRCGADGTIRGCVGWWQWWRRPSWLTSQSPIRGASMLAKSFALANAPAAMMQARVLVRTKLQRQFSRCCYRRRLRQVQRAGTTGRQRLCANDSAKIYGPSACNLGGRQWAPSSLSNQAAGRLHSRASVEPPHPFRKRRDRAQAAACWWVGEEIRPSR
jgi:hypothetical protein